MIARDRDLRSPSVHALSDGKSATELAMIAGDPTTGSAEREDAWKQLLAVIERIASSVAKGHGRHALDCVEDAPGFLWLKIQGFDGAQGQFEPWCARVLRRRSIDLYRHLQRDALGLATTGPVGLRESSDNGEFVLGGANTSDATDSVPIDLRLPFSVADLDSISAWKAADRLALIVAFGLWRKVPRRELNRWMQEIARARRIPWAEFEGTADLPSRLQLLARFLKGKYNSLYQRAKRKTKLLAQLRFAREFYGRPKSAGSISPANRRSTA